MCQSTQSISRISKQPSAPKTHTLRLSPWNPFLGFSQLRLSQRILKTSCLVKHSISCSCWCNSSCNLSICPFKLVEKVPLGDVDYHSSSTGWNCTSGWVMRSLQNPGSEESNGVEVGRCQGSLFWYGFTLFDAAPKVLLERKKQAYPLPQVNSTTGPSHFPSPNGSLYKTEGCGTAGLFCPRCLCMGDFKLSSQLKKIVGVYCQHG